jgi:hypothetical protein
LDEFKATVWRQARVPDREPLPSFPGGVPYLPAAPAGPRGPLAHGGGGIVFCAGCGQTTVMAWLPGDFIHPAWVPVSDGYHLRPVRAADADLDYPAVMGSQPRLWSVFGPAWGWPPAALTYQQDVADLARHEAEIAAHQSFNYALFDDAETALLGCVYIDPPEKHGADAEISWWVVDAAAGTGLERALDALVPQWIAAAWPFTQPRYIGRDLSWADWLALPPSR